MSPREPVLAASSTATDRTNSYLGRLAQSCEHASITFAVSILLTTYRSSPPPFPKELRLCERAQLKGCYASDIRRWTLAGLKVCFGSRAAARGTQGSIARRWARYGPSPAVRLIPCAFLGNPRGISCAHGIALF